MGSQLVCCLCDDQTDGQLDGLVVCEDCKPDIEKILGASSTAGVATSWSYISDSMGVHSRFLQMVLQRMVLQDPGMAAFVADLVRETFPNVRPVTPTRTRKKVLSMISERSSRLSPGVRLPMKDIREIAEACKVAPVYVRKKDNDRKKERNEIK